MYRPMKTTKAWYVNLDKLAVFELRQYKLPLCVIKIPLGLAPFCVFGFY